MVMFHGFLQTFARLIRPFGDYVHEEFIKSLLRSWSKNDPERVMIGSWIPQNIPQTNRVSLYIMDISNFEIHIVCIYPLCPCLSHKIPWISRTCNAIDAMIASMVWSAQARAACCRKEPATLWSSPESGTTNRDTLWLTSTENYGVSPFLMG